MGAWRCSDRAAQGRLCSAYQVRQSSDRGRNRASLDSVRRIDTLGALAEMKLGYAELSGALQCSLEVPG
eukprot:11974511-Alexandrium_andersonii.AAC.1